MFFVGVEFFEYGFVLLNILYEEFIVDDVEVLNLVVSGIFFGLFMVELIKEL